MSPFWSAGASLPLLRCLRIGGESVEVSLSQAAASPPHSEKDSDAATTASTLHDA